MTNIERIWQGLRLVVVDLETAMDANDKHHVVSIGLVTCRNATITGQWQQLVNPGFPIDPETQRIHKIKDAHVANEPSFTALAPLVLSTLTAAPGETLVFCAHHTRFDAPVLRDEFERLGQTMPDLPLLDTAGGFLKAAGVAVRSRKLAVVLEALGVKNPAPHQALSDAAATALLAMALLEKFALAGVGDLAGVLAAAGDSTSAAVEFSGPKRRTEPADEIAIPDTHLSTHADVLPAKPGKRALSAWLKHVEACMDLLCPLLADRVAAAEPPGDFLLAQLVPMLDAAAKAGKTGATATLLGALAPRFCDIAPLPGDRGLRRATLDLEAHLAALLDPLGRCSGTKKCPDCREGRACSLDVWRLLLAEPALDGDPKTTVEPFFRTNGKSAGTGVYAQWSRNGRTALADAVLRLAHRYWIAVGQAARAEQLAQLAWGGGCRDAAIAEAHAIALMRPGQLADLQAALDVCKTALASRRDSTDDAWQSIEIRKTQLEGRIERFRVRYSDEVDEDGKPIPLRRHHPAQPRRPRVGRFARIG